jgi:NADPH-dependent 7-cyano-7-deazaguanine reductase QueF
VKKIKPHYLKIVAEFNPRGNVFTKIEVDTNYVVRTEDVEAEENEQFMNSLENSN